MDSFSKEFLFKECVLHHHCIALHLRESIQWNKVKVYVIYMTDIIIKDEEKELLLQNINKGVNTFGYLNVKAFARQESPYEGRNTMISTDNICEIEIANH